MKLTIPSGDLVAATNRVRPAASGRPDAPGAICVSATDGRVVLEASDGQVGISTVVAATVDKNGSICVPAKTFAAVVAHLGGDVEIDVTAGGVIITDDAGSSTVHTLDNSSSRVVPVPDGSVTATFPAGALTAAVRAVEKAASTSRPALSGVFFDDVDGSLRLVATDSYRIAAVDTDLPALSSTPVVPAAALRIVTKVLAADADASVTADDTRATFDDGTTSITVALITDRFPHYQTVMQVAETATVTVAASTLAAATSRVGAVLTDGQALRIGAASGGLALSAEGPEGNSAGVDVDVESSSGDVPPVGLHPGYLNDALSAVGGTVTVRFGAEDRPVEFSNGSVRWLVMPTKLNV